MKITLEEKKEEIKNLCQNLDQSKIVSVYFDFVSQSIIKIHFKDGYKTFNLNDKNHYKHLIKHLEENQKQPELYTWQEIDRVGKKWIEERHTIKEHTSVFDFLKNNIKPYKKQS